MSSTADRRTDVLRAIVSDYIASHEPVGSKSLVERHALGVSSATIRNDMAVLEAEGYIVQPHTSSGRIPTEKGYRHFVDSIEQITPLSTAQRRAIRAFLEGAVDLDDVLRRAVRLLAQLTQQVAVVQYPVLGRSTVRHLEVVSLAPARLLLVLITDTGRVDQRIVELDEPLAEDHLHELRALLSETVADKRLPDASVALTSALERARPEYRTAAEQCVTVLLETLVEHPDDRIVLGGTANLTRSAADFDGSLRTVLEALEEQVVILRLLSAAQAVGTGGPGGVTVQIGEETQAAEMRGASVVSSVYGPAGHMLGGMGVLGPTRMDYPGTIASVAAVAHYVGEILAGR
ncbi:heat-inducible transcriptional repressor HrcA [Dietzia sp. 179-F 9C3 NHS]|uniref:heat-inducible transcriptional repressor HrcA n=1 Tax=Dietzia sp. 179-F 9C3 NHS TaxID=3374295 RepID=UPI003879FA09